MYDAGKGVAAVNDGEKHERHAQLQEAQDQMAHCIRPHLVDDRQARTSLAHRSWPVPSVAAEPAGATQRS